jgi:hypothetical protein
LDKIGFREKEATAARVTFQKEVVSSSKEEMSLTPKTLRLTVEEKIRGDIILNTWEANIAKSKRLAKEIKEDREEVFDLLDKKSLGIGKDDCARVIGQINVLKHQLNIKERLNESHMEISNLIQVDVAQMDRWLVKPNLHLQSINFEDRRIEDRLSKIQRKLYLFEAKDLLEPSRRLVQFKSRCIECLEPGEGITSKK